MLSRLALYTYLAAIIILAVVYGQDFNMSCTKENLSKNVDGDDFGVYRRM